MRVIIALLLAFLIAGAQCQQRFTLEDCVQELGNFSYDLSNVFRDRTNSAFTSKARSSLQTFFGKCNFAIPNNLGRTPFRFGKHAKKEATQ